MQFSALILLTRDLIAPVLHVFRRMLDVRFVREGKSRSRTGLHRAAASLLRRVLNGLDDVLIARAAAEISLERMADLALGRVRIPIEERASGHDHAWSAVAALEAMHLPEAHLDIAVFTVRGHALDCGQVTTIGLDRQQGATLDRQPVQVDGAGSALARIASDVRSSQAKIVSQETDEEQTRLYLGRVLDTIDFHPDTDPAWRRNRHLCAPPLASCHGGTAWQAHPFANASRPENHQGI